MRRGIPAPACKSNFTVSIRIRCPKAAGSDIRSGDSVGDKSRFTGRNSFRIKCHLPAEGLRLCKIDLIGMAPFGSLLAGSLANKIGAPITILISGLLCTAGALWFASQLKGLRKLIRPIYVKLGIIQEVARGLQAASSLRVPPQE